MGLRGERGCASEPVAREGGMCAGPEGVRRPETGQGLKIILKIWPKMLKKSKRQNS